MQLDWLAPLRLRGLTLQGNPVAASGEEHQRHVVRKLRSVEHLDGVSMSALRQRLMPPLPDTKACIMMPPGIEGPVRETLRRYYHCIDSKDMEELLDAYEKHCMFTFVSETTVKECTHPGTTAYHEFLQVCWHYDAELPPCAHSVCLNNG